MGAGSDRRRLGQEGRGTDHPDTPALKFARKHLKTVQLILEQGGRLATPTLHAVENPSVTLQAASISMGPHLQIQHPMECIVLDFFIEHFIKFYIYRILLKKVHKQVGPHSSNPCSRVNTTDCCTKHQRHAVCTVYLVCCFIGVSANLFAFAIL